MSWRETRPAVLQEAQYEKRLDAAARIMRCYGCRLNSRCVHRSFTGTAPGSAAHGISGVRACRPGLGVKTVIPAAVKRFTSAAGC